MKNSICAYEREEPYFTTYHWCVKCPSADEYRVIERQQKLKFAKFNKEKAAALKNKNIKKDK